MTRVECGHCGITPGDLPYEDLGISLEGAEMLFERQDGGVRCQSCAEVDAEVDAGRMWGDASDADQTDVYGRPA